MGQYYSRVIPWEVEFTDEFSQWWHDLDEGVQDSIDQTVHLLEALGPTLPFPYSSDVKGAKHGNMRDLRRAAVLLIGGCKAGEDRFYERMVPVADRIYDQHLKELETEDRRSK
jgi:hypothetical protein